MGHRYVRAGLGFAAALLLAAGCTREGRDDAQRERSTTEQQTGSTQGSGEASSALERAERSSEEAAEAQERAAEEQGQVAGAQKELREAEQELSSARQEVQKEAGEAQQAQQQAQQESQQAREAMQGAQQASEQQRQEQAGAERQQTEQRRQAQQQATEQQASAAQGSGADERSVSGQVVRAGQLEVVLRREGGEPDLRLTVGPETTVVVQGRQGSMSDLREGAQVRASYDEQDGVPRATRIEVQEAR